MKKAIYFYFCQPGSLLSFPFLDLPLHKWLSLFSHLQLFYCIDVCIFPPWLANPIWPFLLPQLEVRILLITGLDRACQGFSLYNRAKYRKKAGQNLSKWFLLQHGINSAAIIICSRNSFTAGRWYDRLFISVITLNSIEPVVIEPWLKEIPLKMYLCSYSVKTER